jgi:hypothetical protein
MASLFIFCSSHRHFDGVRGRQAIETVAQIAETLQAHSATIEVSDLPWKLDPHRRR